MSGAGTSGAGVSSGSGAGATVIRVGERYDVVVGHGVSDQVVGLVGDGVRQVLLVRPEPLARVAEPVVAGLRAAGLVVHEAAVPDAEAAKTSEVAAGLWGLLGREAFTRTDVVVTVGGGTTTDLGGFVAATWLRGVRVVHVPTTLLAMVDAAVGGKTGINTDEGKNLVGAFHEPAGVLCDLDVLTTLPRVDLVAGLAEVIKTGFIADPRILELVEADPEAALDPGGAVLRELVERSVRVKADVVAQDLRESYLREVLNYGHTLAHAIEQVEGYRMRHGEAVAIGMVFVAELAARAGRLAPEVVARHRSVLTAVGLPVSWPRGGFDDVLAAMRRDKKSRGAVLRFVVLDDVARPARFECPDESLLRAAFATVTSG
ncbi:MAG: 3-dehydroquinate synthase [Dermatophilaceae bacterium]